MQQISSEDPTLPFATALYEPVALPFVTALYEPVALPFVIPSEAEGSAVSLHPKQMFWANR
jgi:hypothetical protein